MEYSYQTEKCPQDERLPTESESKGLDPRREFKFQYFSFPEILFVYQVVHPIFGYLDYSSFHIVSTDSLHHFSID